MVHVKRVELSHFKSFGGTTKIPLLPGFTVVSGPNGSGKSNILDALLFCLGLATSRGMRAERLPDLVNHNRNGRTAETTVSVSFDLSDIAAIESPEVSHTNGESPEWTVTRRLRVGKQGNYTSNYYINGESCTATELHEQLSRLRIYPEGYNVVLQGDVTRIISMNSRERREIIDELAGVAEFDRKIERTRQTLEGVREREERCQIIAQELTRTRDRLAADRLKAEKYQKLKATIQEKQQLEAVLLWRSLQQKAQELHAQITAGETESAQLSQHLNTLTAQITEATHELEELNRRVKALGEDEQLAVASKLATQKAKRHQLEQRQQELHTLSHQHHASLERTHGEIERYRQTLLELAPQKNRLEEALPALESQRHQAKATLQTSREQADAIAAASNAWVGQQTTLTRRITALQKTLNPLRTEQAQLDERYRQHQNELTEQTGRSQTTQQELATKETEITELTAQVAATEQQIHTLAQQLNAAEGERTIAQDTQNRLLREQREKQRQLDKLEATAQAQQEAQGTYATKIILQENLPGVCGLVVQLGQVEPRYQLALETSAGGRLGHIVVEDDGVAAAGIQLLKQQRAGRATFLPLNKIHSSRSHEAVVLRYARGFIDLAVNLVDCPPRYRSIFAYVFGSTAVFQTIDEARPYLGKQRIVTLDGDLLESSGAMTGGSRPVRSSLHFGATAGESAELNTLRRRLDEIEQILARNERFLAQKSVLVKQFTQELTEARQQGREQQLRLEQSRKELERLSQGQLGLEAQQERYRQELAIAAQRLQELAGQIPQLEAQLQQEQQQLSELETSGTSQEWQQIQMLIKAAETQVQHHEDEYRRVQERLKDLVNEQQRLQEKITQSERRIREDEEKLSEVENQKLAVERERLNTDAQIVETEAALAQLSEKLGETKQERDRLEVQVRSLQNKQQQQTWQQQKLQETQQERREALQNLRSELGAQAEELHSQFDTYCPLPDPQIPVPVQLEQIQTELRLAQKRLEAMEPVNMLALEEYEQTQARLEELSGKLATLEAERTELLLRVENFTSLRLRSFKEAFDAVNENFQGIFATLSDGDGYLQLEDAEDPFNGGLTLVAHPKGKPVQRLSSMSGGEKSLTALSFIFALQRYRPSPFYAFDEVDMFLDGANVERLSKMIKQEAQQAQFIVVSLRRPMIESAQRTIGVTQARGAYTQVLGIKL